MLQTAEVSVRGKLERVILPLGHIVKETENKIYVVFQDGMKVFTKDELQTLYKKKESK